MTSTSVNPAGASRFRKAASLNEEPARDPNAPFAHQTPLLMCDTRENNTNPDIIMCTRRTSLPDERFSNLIRREMS